MGTMNSTATNPTPSTLDPKVVWSRLRNLIAMGCASEQVITELPDSDGEFRGEQRVSQALGKYHYVGRGRKFGYHTYTIFDVQLLTEENEGRGAIVAEGYGPYIVAIGELLAHHFGPEFVA